MPTGVPTRAKKCKLCGQEFIPLHPANTICQKNHFRECPICGKKLIWNSTKKVKPCSKECASEQRRQTCLKKYGTLHVMQCEDVKERHRRAIQHHYGVDSPMQSSEILEKMHQTVKEKYGVEWPVAIKFQNKGPEEIHASDCQKYKLSKEIVRPFWASVHKEGVADVEVMSLGLVYRGKVAQVLSLGCPEDSRFAVEILGIQDDPHFYVIDGPSLLFNWAIEYYSIEGLVAYCYPSAPEMITYARLGLIYSGLDRRGRLIYTY